MLGYCGISIGGGRFMRKKSKILIAFILVLTFLCGCEKEKNYGETNKEIVNDVSNKKELTEEDNEAKAENKPKDKVVDDSAKAKVVKKDLAKTKVKCADNFGQVVGAKIGSLSSYAEDRKVWDEFIDKEFMNTAKSYVNGIHLPRILLDSDDARRANAEIDAIAKKMKETYKANKANMSNGASGIVASFSVFQNEKILSIMVENYDIWNGEYTNHHVYNFSLPDGKFIDDDELMKDFDLDKDSILTLAENGLIKNADSITKTYCRDITDLSYTSNPNNLIGLMLNDLWDNYKSKSHKLFIDEVGRANFVFDGYESVNTGQGPLVFKLESDRFDRSPYSDQYIRMARGLGLNPYDENNKAFVIYLGGVNDEKNLKASMEKLQTWSNVFLNSEDPNMLVAIKQSEGGDMPYLIGEQCYLLIPKYKNASVSLKELEITQDGKLKAVENPYLDFNACSGNTLICQNISDLGPNGKITIRYRDDVIEFSPQLSGKDGSVILTDGILNGENIIDWKNEVQDGFYSYIIFERIKNLMGVG